MENGSERYEVRWADTMKPASENAFSNEQRARDTALAKSDIDQSEGRAVMVVKVKPDSTLRVATYRNGHEI